MKVFNRGTFLNPIRLDGYKYCTVVNLGPEKFFHFVEINWSVCRPLLRFEVLAFLVETSVRTTGPLHEQKKLSLYY